MVGTDVNHDRRCLLRASMLDGILHERVAMQLALDVAEDQRDVPRCFHGKLHRGPVDGDGVRRKARRLLRESDRLWTLWRPRRG
jgi:hypothetical protein